jgi:HKD family nuclease
MRLISSSKDLEDTFSALINSHDYFSCLVAWAGVNSAPFVELQKNENKIIQAVIGTHFYQTSPDFIKSFIKNRQVKFVKHTDGIFHPKVFLFYSDSGNFDLITGSANLTHAAFSRNFEIATHISVLDKGAETIISELKFIINHWFCNASYFDDHELTRYRSIWKLQQRKIEGLSGSYGSDKQNVNVFFNSPVATMTWRDFIQAIQTSDSHGITERLSVLDECKRLFNSVAHFNELDGEARKFIAGIPNHHPINPPRDWAFFGSMRGRGDFANRIHVNNPLISSALDNIPLEGEINRKHFDGFIREFTQLFSGNYIGCATRLMAMKRPDYFYCLTKANKKRFCLAFGLHPDKIDYNIYWDGVIGRLADCPWYAEAEPMNEQEDRIALAKAAFLDAIYYVPKK